MRAIGPIFVSAIALFASAALALDECPEVWIEGDIRPAPGQVVEVAAFADGFFTKVGARALLEEAAPVAACVRTLPEGAVAFAGLHDGHAHLSGIGLRELELNLEGTRSVADLQARVADAAARTEADVLFGRGWIETGWPEGRMPTRDDLDAVVSDRPVILSRSDGHAVVVNSAAIEAAGITDDTPDPDGGRIERDESGRATGILVDNAERYVLELVPQMDAARMREAVRVGAEHYAAYGWTTVHNMSVTVQEVEALEALAEDGELPLRVFNYVVPEALETVAQEGPTCVADERVCTIGVKFYVDGALGSRGALLFAPYSDDPENSGLLLSLGSELQAAWEVARQAGLQVTSHAIGDRANRLVLDWYFESLNARGIEDHRWRIEHAQIMRRDDLRRFERQGVIASMQPSHAIGDLFFAPDRLGDSRLRGAYAWQSIVASGGILVGGTDAPVEIGDPRIELHAATRRFALNGFEDENWHAEEALLPDQALAIFTTNAAFAIRREEQLGQIAPGFRADMTVFSADPFVTPWDDVDVLMTILGGERTH